MLIGGAPLSRGERTCESLGNSPRKREPQLLLRS
jgi:hypothetical protein